MPSSHPPLQFLQSTCCLSHAPAIYIRPAIYIYIYTYIYPHAVLFIIITRPPLIAQPSAHIFAASPRALAPRRAHVVFARHAPPARGGGGRVIAWRTPPFRRTDVCLYYPPIRSQPAADCNSNAQPVNTALRTIDITRGAWGQGMCTADGDAAKQVHSGSAGIGDRRSCH